LIEAGYSAWCEQTWLVAADNDTALERLMRRDAFSREEAQQRLDSQRKWQDREPASDHVFHNDGTPDEFLAAVDAEIERVRDSSAAGTLPKTRWFEWSEANPPPERSREQSAERS
jgi:dephospho-CoA kinase